MDEVLSRQCVPCSTDIPALKGAELAVRQQELASDWQVIDEHHLEKEYRFQTFRDALAFANRVGAIAEHAGHHPDMYVSWGKVKLTIWTHKSNGLTDSDFILAKAADQAM